jgi:tetratricopeptide (TPR) repeat protein
MAGKVNVKFVVILSTVLVVLFIGVAATAILVLRKSGDDLMRLGDARAAEGNYKAAAELYSKAVNKEQRNVVFQERWRDTLRKWVPETQVQLETGYSQHLVPLLRTIAISKQTDVPSHIEYLASINEGLLQGGFSSSGHENLINEAENAIKYFDASGTDQSFQTLRRYRGLAITRQIREGLEVPADKVEQAKSDFEAALKVNPKDEDSHVGLIEFYSTRAEISRRKGQDLVADELYTEADKATQAFAAACPDSPMSWVLSLATKMDQTRRDEIGKPNTTDMIGRVRARLDQLKPQFDQLVERLSKLPPSQLSGRLMDRFKILDAMANSLKPTRESTEKLLRASLAAEPNNFDQAFRLADLCASQSRYQDAITELARFEKFPALPVGLDALRLNGRKTEAVYLQSLFALRMADESTDASVRDSAFAQGKQFRENLGKILPQDAPLLKKLDARIAMLNKDTATAMKLLTQYNQATGNSDSEGCWLLGRAALATNQTGLARQQFSRMIELEPGNAAGTMALADIETRLQNYSKAEQLYQTMVDAQPSNTMFRERLQMVQSLSRGIAQTGDKITAALIEAQKLSTGTGDKTANLDKAIEVIAAAQKDAPDDLRLTLGMVSLLIDKGDKEAATKVVAAALEKTPDNPQLKQAMISLTAASPAEARITMIEGSAMSELDKAAELYNAYRDAGKKAESDKALDTMAKLAPDDARTFEGLFIRAVEAKDLQTARKITEEAVRKDIDKVGGLTFTARLSLAEGKDRDAILALEEAAKTGNINPQTWILLARLQLKAGRGSDAVASYTSALQLRPDDVAMIKERIGALASQGLGSDALAAANEGERYAKNDPDFQKMQLLLQSAYGDETAKKTAMTRRKELAAKNPADNDNLIALAAIQMDAGQYADAKKIIDQAVTNGDTIDTTGLLARWHADQNDIASAIGAWNTYLAKQTKETINADMYLSFGQFLISRNLVEFGVRTFQKAREFQDPKTLPADKALGDAYSRLGQFEQATEAYKRVVEGNADTEDRAFAKRLIEQSIRLRKYDDAEKVLATFGDALESDPVLMLLKSDVFRGREDFVKARELMDRTIVKFPQEPLAYVRRAELVQSQAGNESDILADLDAAMRVNPRSWQALSMRASILLRQDRVDEAVRDIRAAMAIVPGNDDMRIGITRELLRRGQERPAVEINDEAIRLRPSDAQLLISIGALFVESGAYARGHEYNKRAFLVSKNPTVATAYLQGLLADPASPVSEAEGVLKELGNDAISKDPTLLMYRAQLLSKRNKLAEAQDDLSAAVKLLPRGNAGAIVYWDSQCRLVFKGNAERHLAYLETLKGTGEIGDWFAFLRANQKITTGKQDQMLVAVDELSNIIKTTSSEPVLQAAHRMRTSTLYMTGKFEEVVVAAKSALERFPDDWEINNNVAFTLSKKLGRAAEGLPFAEKAAAANPNNPDVWDTLGATQLSLGKLPEAQQSLSRGLAAAGATSARIPVLVHLIDLQVARKDKETGKLLIKQAIEDIKRFPEVGKNYQAELDELTKKIETM